MGSLTRRLPGTCALCTISSIIATLRPGETIVAALSCLLRRQNIYPHTNTHPNPPQTPRILAGQDLGPKTQNLGGPNSHGVSKRPLPRVSLQPGSSMPASFCKLEDWQRGHSRGKGQGFGKPPMYVCWCTGRLSRLACASSSTSPAC
jgi:hypothetical protein